MKLTAKQVMDRYSITKQTLNEWRKNGKIKYTELSPRKFMYDLLDTDTRPIEQPNTTFMMLTIVDGKVVPEIIDKAELKLILDE